MKDVTSVGLAMHGQIDIRDDLCNPHFINSLKQLLKTAVHLVSILAWFGVNTKELELVDIGCIYVLRIREAEGKQ
eukprot:2739869-Ditylum_brightwellii.AAC.1